MSRGIVAEYTLTSPDVAGIERACGRLAASLPGPADPRFYDEHWDIDRYLPVDLRVFLERFRRTESAAACLIHGFPVDDEAAGATPDHWQRQSGPSPTLRQELFLAMCGTALGEPFTWPTLQLGRMIQDILPIRGDEQRQSGHGSESALEFHTEDGFHPGRPDYLLLFGIRNHDRVPTTVASVREVRLGSEDVDLLRQPLFRIRPDDEHVRQLGERCPNHPALTRVRKLQERPREVPALFGCRARPYIPDRPPVHVLCEGERGRGSGVGRPDVRAAAGPACHRGGAGQPARGGQLRRRARPHSVQAEVRRVRSLVEAHDRQPRPAQVRERPVGEPAPRALRG